MKEYQISDILPEISQNAGGPKNFSVEILSKSEEAVFHFIHRSVV
jgi:hypothetical protein